MRLLRCAQRVVKVTKSLKNDTFDFSPIIFSWVAAYFIFLISPEHATSIPNFGVQALTGQKKNTLALQNEGTKLTLCVSRTHFYNHTTVGNI